MPRTRCPYCRAVQTFQDAERGKTLPCPQCGATFRAPGGSKAPDADDGEVDELDEVNDPTERRKSDRTQKGRDEPRPRPARRGVRCIRKTSGLPEFLTQWNVGKVLLAGLVGVWIVLAITSFYLNAIPIGIFVAGIVLVLAARFWVAMVASQDGEASGCLMLISPWYFVRNLFVLSDRRPLLLLGVGLFYTFSGLFLAVVTGSGR